MLEDLFRLDEKVIIITGASGLLGEKHAEAIACYGGTPVLIDLSLKKLNKRPKISRLRRAPGGGGSFFIVENQLSPGRWGSFCLFSF